MTSGHLRNYTTLTDATFACPKDNSGAIGARSGSWQPKLAPTRLGIEGVKGGSEGLSFEFCDVAQVGAWSDNAAAIFWRASIVAAFNLGKNAMKASSASSRNKFSAFCNSNPN
jgi:hypothetical protein